MTTADAQCCAIPAATRGASGAPVLARTPDGSWIVAGVAAGARRDLKAAPQGTGYVGAPGGAAVPAGAIDLSAAIQPAPHLPGQSVGIVSPTPATLGTDMLAGQPLARPTGRASVLPQAPNPEDARTELVPPG